MHARRSHLPLLRRVALTAALAALLAPAGAAEAAMKKPRKPVVTSISPMNAEVGDTMTIRGRYFRRGKNLNTVAFRRSGGRTVFVKADVSTLRRMYVKLPEKLADEMLVQGTAKVPTVFQVRILARRFGKRFTALSKSPTIAPDTPREAITPTSPPPGAPPAAAAPNQDCDADGVLNQDEADDDNDLLDDALEAKLMTDPCSADTDGDGVEDGYEYRSAVDLNDDEFQQPNTALPYPGKRPYPNPLFAEDTGFDHDGDGLTLRDEHNLWKYSYEVARTAQRTLSPLSYSAGMQYSVHAVCRAPYPADSPCAANPNSEGRRYPTLRVENYERWFGANGFYTWARGNGYQRVVLGWNGGSAGEVFDILDVNLSGVVSDGGFTTDGIADAVDSEGPEYARPELYAFAMDRGLFMSDEERDEDADGLSNYDEILGRMSRTYWEKCYSDEKPFPARPGQATHPLSAYDADSDGDGVRDGADDEDNDDVPNVMELSRIAASGFDDTEDGSKPPVLQEGQQLPVPSVGPDGPAFASCKADKELGPWKAEGNSWHAGEYGRVNPFNPCLPFKSSRTCPRIVELGPNQPAPYDHDGPEHWYALQ